jgi:hypothetical protein
MQFRTKFLWEFIQNLTLVSGLMLALQLWQEAVVISSILAMVAGSLLGAAVIRVTESKIVGHDRAGLQGKSEPIAVTITNFILMFVFMLALTVYLTAAWSSMATDLLVGALIGLLLSAGQSKAAGRPVGWRHSLAFAAAFPAALITIRVFSATLPVIVGILLITAVVTLIITYIDYGQLSTIEEGAS